MGLNPKPETLRCRWQISQASVAHPLNNLRMAGKPGGRGSGFRGGLGNVYLSIQDHTYIYTHTLCMSMCVYIYLSSYLASSLSVFLPSISPIFVLRTLGWGMEDILYNVPRGSIYTTIRESGPKILYYRRDHGSQFFNGCICGPSGVGFLDQCRVLGWQSNPLALTACVVGPSLLRRVGDFVGLGFRV